MGFIPLSLIGADVNETMLSPVAKEDLSLEDTGALPIEFMYLAKLPQFWYLEVCLLEQVLTLEFVEPHNKVT